MPIPVIAAAAARMAPMLAGRAAGGAAAGGGEAAAGGGLASSAGKGAAFQGGMSMMKGAPGMSQIQQQVGQVMSGGQMAEQRVANVAAYLSPRQFG